MQQYTLGRALQAGDTLGIVTPSAPLDETRFQAGLSFLHSLGLRTRCGRSVQERWGYLAGTDDVRAQDINEFFADPAIDGILCMRGGYGAARLLPLLDFDDIARHPKLFIGFSDITVFHSKLNTLGIESMHAPMPKSFRTTNPAALLRLKEFLFGKISSYRLPPHPFNREGIVQAELTGGNLTLLHCLRSSVLECKHQSSILFMEDVGENLYSIDRMLQSLKLTDKFSKLQGLIVGDFTEMKGLNFGKDAYEIIQEVFADYAYPICFGFPAGHAENNFPLIIGSTIEMEISATGTTIHFQND